MFFCGGRHGDTITYHLSMEHSYIKDHHIADRYLSGKLSAEERMRFEEHFVDCAECHDRLWAADNFRAGLRIVAAEDATRFRAHLRVRQAGVLARAAWLIWRRRAPLLAVVILLIALPMALLVLEWSGARRDLAQATQASSEWRRKYEEGEQAARGLAKVIQARERESYLQRERLAAQLELMQKASDSPFPQPRKAAEYQSETPVFALSVVRGDGSNLSQPVNRIALAPSSRWMILLLELEPDPDLHSYRCAISTTAGRSIWTRDDLKPNSKNALALSFDSKLFKPDDYLLTLEGDKAQEGRVLIATYTFRITLGR
jgi:anti-sigma factor RsiW